MENNTALFILYLVCSLYAFISCTKNFINVLKAISRNEMIVQYFIYMIFYFFFIFPIAINVVCYDYHYQIFYRADDAMRDYSSNIIYCIFVITFSYSILRSVKKEQPLYKPLLVSPGIINVCTIVMIICLALTIIVAGIQVLTGGYGYAYINREIPINEAVIGCGVISYLVILGHRKVVSKFRLFYTTIIVFCFFWIVGKRYIIAETMIMAIGVMGMTGSLNGKKMVRYLFIGGTLIVGLGFLYGVFFKENVTNMLDYLNVDFSRQYTLVYQFYCDKIGRVISINPYDGIIFLCTFFVPRIMWEDKPYPFVNNLTLSLVGQDEVEFMNAGWATTCSVFSDLFDSFSYFGLIIGIFVFVKLFHKANRERRVPYKVLLVYLLVRMITVQLSSAIVQMTVVYLIILIFSLFTKQYEYLPNKIKKKYGV